MEVKEPCDSYYGRLDGPKPVRTFAQDIVRERQESMMEDLKTMEERIKRHITECKREIIKEIQLTQQPEYQKLKEIYNDGCKTSKPAGNVKRRRKAFPDN